MTPPHLLTVSIPVKLNSFPMVHFTFLIPSESLEGTPTFCLLRFPRNQVGSRATFRKELPREVQIKVVSFIEHYFHLVRSDASTFPLITRYTRPTGRRRDAPSLSSLRFG